MKKENISKAFLEVKTNMEEDCKKKKIMKEIELQTEKKIVNCLVNGDITNPIAEKNPIQQDKNENTLLNILSIGAKQYEKNMGRRMTYGEMREMYG